MKKAVKILLIIAGVCALLGIAVAAIGFALGGRLDETWRIGNYFDSREPYGSEAAPDNTYAVDAAGIRSLEIEWVGGQVNVVKGEGEQITFAESGNRLIENNRNLTWKTEDGALLIRFAERETYNLRKSLTVTVPNDLADSIIVSGTGCDITVDGVMANRTTLSTNSGAITYTDNTACRILEIGTNSGYVTVNGTADEIKVSTNSAVVDITPSGKVSGLTVNATSADIAFTGVFEEGKINTNSGTIDLALTEGFDKLQIDTTSGRATLTFPETVGFSIDYDSTGGELITELPIILKGSERFIGDGAGRLSMTTCSGDLTLIGK